MRSSSIRLRRVPENEEHAGVHLHGQADRCERCGGGVPGDGGVQRLRLEHGSRLLVGEPGGPGPRASRIPGSPGASDTRGSVLLHKVPQ